MSFTPFELEHWQSRYETTVDFNLADSGVHPVRLGELVDDDEGRAASWRSRCTTRP